MDIIQLLEVLKPSGNVITVKLDDGKNLWDSIEGLLIAILPAFIAGMAMFVSYRQFRVSMYAQSKQFNQSIEQQLKTLKLNTLLSTEVELKKDDYKEVRKAFIEYMKYHSELFHAKVTYRILNSPDSGATPEQKMLAHESVMEKGQLSLDAKVRLNSYLNMSDDDEKTFNQSLNQLSQLAFAAQCSGEDLGSAQQTCSKLCSNYLEKKRKEIFGLVATISE